MSLIGEHDPLQLADAVATLDTLSNGRFVLGVGWGWNREEFADHGRPPELRAEVVEEWVLVMRELWTHDVASFKGRFVTLQPSRMWPKPLQRPGPPILLGGPASQRNFGRIARWGDGWITMGETIERGRLRADLDALRQAWEGAGREDAGLRVTLIHNPLPAAPAAGGRRERRRRARRRAGAVPRVRRERRPDAAPTGSGGRGHADLSYLRFLRFPKRRGFLSNSLMMSGAAEFTMSSAASSSAATSSPSGSGSGTS